MLTYMCVKQLVAMAVCDIVLNLAKCVKHSFSDVQIQHNTETVCETFILFYF